jgi:nucleotide-binding universal stress UspA family protein
VLGDCVERVRKPADRRRGKFRVRAFTKLLAFDEVLQREPGVISPAKISQRAELRDVDTFVMESRNQLLDLELPGFQLSFLSGRGGARGGHSRLREWVLGGVTRDLLLRADRCSLVSH